MVRMTKAIRRKGNTLANVIRVGNPVGNVGNRVGNVGNAVAEEADIEQIVMDSLRGNGKVSAAKMAKITKVTTRTVERALVRLKASGRIRRRGGTRGVWEIIG